MEVSDHVVPPAATPRRRVRLRFQFSLRAVLIVMTCSAVLLSALFAGPSWVAVVMGILHFALLPMCATIGLIYGRGYLQTFCIGSLFPTGTILVACGPYSWMMLGGLIESADQFARLYIVAAIVINLSTAVLFGLAAVALRWLIEQSARPADADTPF